MLPAASRTTPPAGNPTASPLNRCSTVSSHTPEEFESSKATLPAVPNRFPAESATRVPKGLDPSDPPLNECSTNSLQPVELGTSSKTTPHPTAKHCESVPPSPVAP